MATVTEDLPKEVICNHPAYQGHKLKRVATDQSTFTCDGCFMSGAGARYRLQHEGGNLDHHICCAVAPVTQPKLTHPKFGDLAFHPVPPARTNGKGRFCGACGEGVIGFVYHSSGTGVFLHPCCALQSCKCSAATAEKTRRLAFERHRNPYPRQGC